MNVIAEGDLQITLPPGVTARKFDDKKMHGLSHCMKAVDFIIELDEKILFIEFKDPQHPKARPESREEFIKEFLSGQIDAELKTKYRDSFLYEWGFQRNHKPIHYYVLIGLDRLSGADLLRRSDALKRNLPMQGPNGSPWAQRFVAECIVMNLAAWNRNLPDFPIARVGASDAD